MQICRSRDFRKWRKEAHLGIDVSDFLDGATFTSPTMSSRDNTPIGALPKFFDILVFRINDEGRIESGKAMSLHIQMRYVQGKDQSVDYLRESTRED